MKKIARIIAFGICVAIATDMPLYAQQTQGGQNTSLINISVSRSTQAVNYRDRTSTKVDFQGTALIPRADGRANVNARDGRVEIKAELDGLLPATSFGPAYLTYVLWAISPEGRASNLGEILLDGDGGKLTVTTRLQTFGLIVTAEPYFAVTSPSEMVVVENIVRKDTKGAVTSVDAKFDLLQRGLYDDLHLEAMQIDPQVPLALYEARNAVRIAQAQQADKYASESMAKAVRSLSQAEDYQTHKQKQPVQTAARDAVQASEDARTIAVKRRNEEQVSMAQKAADDKAAQAKAAQEEEAQKREEADRQKMQAELDAAREAKARAEADTASQAAMLREQVARDQAAQSAQQAQQAQAQVAQAEKDKQELRAKLLAQFNRILDTKDTDRGLVVNMGDVLFDTGKFALRPPAREALAKLSGIVLNYPGLRLQIEGHTDSTGSAEFNQTLSGQRANSVRDYLTQQGIDGASIASMGLGEDIPVADNKTADGRQKNRRVEIIVSGEVIGTKIGTR